MIALWLGWLLVLSPTGQHLIHAKSYEGCLFTQSVCDEHETCFNDEAFGRCITPGQTQPSEVYRYSLTGSDLDKAQIQLNRLFEHGYTWTDEYTQCIIDTLLAHFRQRGYSFEYDHCQPLALEQPSRRYNQIDDVDDSDELTHDVDDADEDDTSSDSRSLASIRFTPSAADPRTQYADEVYYPLPLSTGDHSVPRIVPLDAAVLPDEDEAPPPRYRGLFAVESPILTKKSMSGMPAIRAREPVSLDELDNPLKGARSLRFLDPDSDSADDAPAFLRSPYNTPERFREGLESSDTVDPFDLLMASTGGLPRPLHEFSPHYNTPTSFRRGQESRDLDSMSQIIKMAEEDAERFLEERQREKERENWANDGNDNDDDSDSWRMLMASRGRGFSQLYNTPDSFRAGLETRDVDDGSDFDDESISAGVADVPSPLFLRPSRIGSPRNRVGQLEFQENLEQRQSSDPNIEVENQNEDEDEQEQDQLEAREDMARFLQEAMRSGVLPPAMPDEIQADEAEVERDPGPGRAYTEGGLVFLPDKQTAPPDALGALLEWGFKRRERLDVKKPGPLFSTNNYAFRQEPAQYDDTPRLLPVAKGPPQTQAYHAPPPNALMQHMNVLKGGARFGESDSDPDLITVKLKNKISTWYEGDRLISALESALNLAPSTLDKRRVDQNQVSFRVKDQSHMNASEIAKLIATMKEEIKKRTNMDIESASVGEEASALKKSLPEWRQSNFVLGGVVASVSLAAVLVSAVTYYAVRRLQRSRDKLRGIAAPDTEASKDYQDLCRARMAKKAESERPDPLHTDQRVASLSRESEGSNNSPSSRSSTSSWTEEPALTNMDISTGHMVLAYMEDHLKNKDRLEQEWQALCAYEAEPCETTVANKPENVNKNRYYPHILPYDHSRVVLNELANATGSDYINASTITDHDPRNPAYLATQGPLPHTAADLWQLIWEQGSVVMVMLTRLTENGTAMCHRYWPEEGSERYHNYEVHLVSEHIWCDDYLVRSFYLKNMQTGETRTVTQFHFHSWPDHGVPPSTKPLLDFRRKVNKSYRGRSCPIVVHCSDGAGRTGTYCLLDMVLNRMAKGAKEIDIAATLEHIRDQRANMVESREQFEFCLAAVADEVHAILKALPPQPTPPPVALDKKTDENRKKA